MSSYRKSRCQGGWSPEIRWKYFYIKIPGDRLIATTNEPKLTLGGLAILEVIDTGKNGAFLDWGLEKDLFLPFREQTTPVKKGDSILVSLYIDKSARLCATMKVYEKLSCDSPYQKDDMVEGIVYELSDRFGVFVAVDGKYSALIPKREVYHTYRVGETIRARVAAVKDNGKLDLSVREKPLSRWMWMRQNSWNTWKRTVDVFHLQTRRLRRQSAANLR